MKSIKILILSSLAFFTACQNKAAGETKELTIFGMFNKMIFNSEWPVFKEASTKTGITLKGTISQNATSETEAFNLMVASGNMPDIVRYYLGPSLEKLGVDGGLIPLEDLVKQHAPNIQKFWDENPSAKALATAYDGHIYFIPYYLDNKIASVYYFRKDWLDKLGLPAPVTIEDYYNTLKAFKTKDPNGNGKADEVPLFARINDVEWGLDTLFDIFQVRYPWKATDTEFSFDPITPQYRNAVRELAKWYKEGLIDPEFFTREAATVRDYMFGNNIGGATVDWASTASYIASSRASIPDFDLIITEPPMIKGRSISYRPRLSISGGWGVSSQAKDPVTVIKYFDYWFSPEGRRLWNFGIEGQQYTMKDGTPVFTDLILKDKAPLAALYKIGAQWEIGTRQDFAYERQVAQPLVAEGYARYLDKNLVANNYALNLKYSTEDLQEFQKLEADIKSYTMEMAQKWILGAADVDKDWDAYIKHLDTLKVKRLIELNKAAWDRHIQAGK